GSGREDQEVRELLAKFQTMRQMMGELGQQSGLLSKIPGFKTLGKMKQLANLDMSKIMSAMPDLAEEARKKSRAPLLRNADRDKEKRKRKQARKDRKKQKRKK